MRVVAAIFFGKSTLSKKFPVQKAMTPKIWPLKHLETSNAGRTQKRILKGLTEEEAHKLLGEAPKWITQQAVNGRLAKQEIGKLYSNDEDRS